MTANPQPNPVFPPPQRKTPQQIASAVADYVRAGHTVIAWATLGALIAGLAFLAIRTLIFGCRLVLQALGV